MLLSLGAPCKIQNFPLRAEHTIKTKLKKREKREEMSNHHIEEYGVKDDGYDEDNESDEEGQNVEKTKKKRNKKLFIDKSRRKKIFENAFGCGHPDDLKVGIHNPLKSPLLSPHNPLFEGEYSNRVFHFCTFSIFSGDFFYLLCGNIIKTSKKYFLPYR